MYVMVHGQGWGRDKSEWLNQGARTFLADLRIAVEQSLY
jgi:hypothetical protein